MSHAISRSKVKVTQVLFSVRGYPSRSLIDDLHFLVMLIVLIHKCILLFLARCGQGVSNAIGIGSMLYIQKQFMYICHDISGLKMQLCYI